MNAKTLSSLAGAALLFSSLSLSANEILLTEDAAKSSNRGVALDFVNSGEATAFEFEVVVPKGVTSVNTSKCLSELPSTHTGGCSYNEKLGRVVVIVLSMHNAPLPKGVVPVGTLSFDGMLKGAAGVDKVVVADMNAKALEVNNSRARSSEVGIQSRDQVK